MLLAIKLDESNDRIKQQEVKLRKTFSKDFVEKTIESCLRDNDRPTHRDQKKYSDERRLELLKTKADFSKLEHNKEHNFAVLHTSLHYRSNTLCTWIPKNGCSNLRYAIARENGAISNIKEIQWIHTNNHSFNANTKEALQADYTFVVLRNPFKRLLSFFLDKLCTYKTRIQQTEVVNMRKACLNSIKT